jgi:restriction endonuclease Mrr
MLMMIEYNLGVSIENTYYVKRTYADYFILDEN